VRIGEVDLEMGDEGYVIGPCGFHDAEICSVFQNQDSVAVTIKLVAPDFDGQKIVLTCHGLKYIYYSTGFVQNVIFGLWVFEKFADENFESSLSPAAKSEFSRAIEIIRTTTTHVKDHKGGVILYAEPCGENELLVLCDRISAEFIK
jgi:hypothetical protein